MNRYALTGNFRKTREEAFLELEKVIQGHGFVVAFERISDESVNLLLEVNETLLAGLISNLKNQMDLYDSRIVETNPAKFCNVHLYCKFS